MTEKNFNTSLYWLKAGKKKKNQRKRKRKGKTLRFDSFDFDKNFLSKYDLQIYLPIQIKKGTKTLNSTMRRPLGKYSLGKSTQRIT